MKMKSALCTILFLTGCVNSKISRQVEADRAEQIRRDQIDAASRTNSPNWKLIEAKRKMDEAAKKREEKYR